MLQITCKRSHSVLPATSRNNRKYGRVGVQASRLRLVGGVRNVAGYSLALRRFRDCGQALDASIVGVVVTSGASWRRAVAAIQASATPMGRPLRRAPSVTSADLIHRSRSKRRTTKLLICRSILARRVSPQPRSSAHRSSSATVMNETTSTGNRVSELLNYLTSFTFSQPEALRDCTLFH